MSSLTIRPVDVAGAVPHSMGHSNLCKRVECTVISSRSMLVFYHNNILLNAVLTETSKPRTGSQCRD